MQLRRALVFKLHARTFGQARKRKTESSLGVQTGLHRAIHSEAARPPAVEPPLDRPRSCPLPPGAKPNAQALREYPVRAGAFLLPVASRQFHEESVQVPSPRRRPEFPQSSTSRRRRAQGGNPPREGRPSGRQPTRARAKAFRQRPESIFEAGQAAFEEAALGFLPRQRERGAIGFRSFRDPAQTP